MDDQQKPDWRHSYQDQSRMHEDEFRDQRSRAVNFYYAVPWSRHMKNVRHMTDDQISALARREAEKDVTRAINIWNENH